jgi:hypothetical protein
MARPWVADRGTAWRLAANTLTKQPRTDKGRSSSLWVAHGANNPSPYKTNLLRNINMSLGLGRIPWLNDLSDGIWTWDLEHGMLEVCIGRVH